MTINRLRAGRALCLALITGAAGERAMAQERPAETPAPASTSVQVYEPGFFSAFQPNNAEDVLRRIPGAGAVLDDTGGANNQQQRGFGNAGARVLLNGRRFPGKAQDITTTLRRIAAASIARVELITGASSEISVQSQGLAVNIVLVPDASIDGAGAYELNGRFNNHGSADIDGLINYSRSFGRLTLSGGVERNAWVPTLPYFNLERWTWRTRAETYYYPNGALQELRPQTWSRDVSQWTLTGSATLALGKEGELSLNGIYRTADITADDLAPIIRYDPQGRETLRADEFHRRESDGESTLEIGGELRTTLGPGNFSTLFIIRRQHTPTLDFRNRTEPTRLVEVSRSDGLVDTGEDILRGTFSLPLGANRTLEIGGEGARNTLSQRLDVFYDFNNDGQLERAVVPIADPTVKELRGEGFVNLKWQPLPKLSLDGTLNYEYSRLTTNYPLNPVRTLGFLKPRLDARYRLTGRDQLRVLVERTVSQLNFANFVPRYNVIDDRIESGNPALRPEKTWVYELGLEHRFRNDGGRVNLTAYYNDITDAIDRIPLRAPDGQLVSASGNIPDAYRYGAIVTASIRLGFISLRDAVLTTSAERRNSSIVDPFLGRVRRLSNDRKYRVIVDFRHDVPRLKLSYGVNYFALGAAAVTSDLLFTDFYNVDPLLDFFVERTLSRSSTLRLEVQNIVAPERRFRIQYLTNSIDGVVRRRDLYHETRDLRWTVKLRGRF